MDNEAYKFLLQRQRPYRATISGQIGRLPLDKLTVDNDHEKIINRNKVCGFDPGMV